MSKKIKEQGFYENLIKKQTPWIRDPRSGIRMMTKLETCALISSHIHLKISGPWCWYGQS
jgi:hypothetical protein